MKTVITPTLKIEKVKMEGQIVEGRYIGTRFVFVVI